MQRLLSEIRRTAAAGLILAVLVGLAGCGPQAFDDPGAFRDYVTDTGGPFVQTADHDHVTVRARYAPPIAMALPAAEHAAREKHRVLKQTTLSDSARTARLKRVADRVRDRRAAYDGSLHFYLTIEPKEGDLVYDTLQRRGFGAYQQWLRRLLFGLQEKIHLRTDTVDEVPLSVYRMDRSFGMAKHRTFLLAFPATFNDTDLAAGTVDLVVEEFGLRTGALTFTFDVSDLRKSVRLDPLG